MFALNTDPISTRSLGQLIMLDNARYVFSRRVYDVPVYA